MPRPPSSKPRSTPELDLSAWLPGLPARHPGRGKPNFRIHPCSPQPGSLPRHQALLLRTILRGLHPHRLNRNRHRLDCRPPRPLVTVNSSTPGCSPTPSPQLLRRDQLQWLQQGINRDRNMTPPTPRNLPPMGFLLLLRSRLGIPIPNSSDETTPSTTGTAAASNASIGTSLKAHWFTIPCYSPH